MDKKERRACCCGARTTASFCSAGNIYAILLICIAASWPGSGSASITCSVEAKTSAANIDGELLVLSAGSLSFNGPHPSSPVITDAAACANACGSLPGCNAWTFCNKPAGCGSGCSSWVAKYPKLTTEGPGNPDPTDVDLPVVGFGAWTFPHTANGCQYSFATGNTSNAWPYGLCSLKRVADPASPKYFSSKPAGVVTESSGGDGWVSGTLSVSSDCKGLPANVCRQCGASKNPDKCLKCARDVRAQYSKKPIRYLLNKGNKAQNACAVCASLTDASQQGRCFDCILNNGRCSTCIYGAQMWGYGKPNIGACLVCAAKKGDSYVGGCNACTQSKEPGRCFACLDSFPLKFCPPGVPVGTDGCEIGPNDQTPCDKCSNSALSDSVFKQCTSCLMSDNWEQECLDCGTTPTTADGQARCYKCVQTARFPSYQYTGCATCFASWLLPGKTQACLDCVEDSGTSMAAKSSCSSCVDGSQQRSQAKQAQCFNCLKTPQQEYSAVCLR